MSLVVTAALITPYNALTVMLALMLWNGVLGKFGELGRTLKEFHPCSKWFFLASIFGGTIAILGSFMAMDFIGGAFAAVSGLLYPVIGRLHKVRIRRERGKNMVQTAAAMEAYNAYRANSFIPAAEIMWMVLILILAVIALWQARTFVSRF
ncbi:Choline permease LicB [Methanosarcina siciliae T4/M]|uniref:Choline permease LicB n=3 Tax=Methanosarcina siciliae TaxID=38027 RepID=A0A0E3LA66_9EURY|nr:Choline permease LicB [Methanosarcina siciliae T4/M]AKB31486.1 Choline permease LicB [Methanosarcina siciliae HI350]